jgi:photosystem II stability/assembly factor-like uncharacterized protein
VPDQRTWRRTNLQAAGSRTDDICFVDEHIGWAVNSDGGIWLTENGGDGWIRQAHLPDSYLRCVSFVSPSRGWVGTLSGPHRLYETRDAGTTWAPVQNLPDDAPSRICGLHAVDASTVFASGTNYPNETAGVVRSRDDGASWTALEVPGAALLVDIFFEDSDRGWVVGGVDTVQHPDRPTSRSDVVPGVFRTTDGGESWTNLVALNADLDEFPRGEWGWKVQKVSAAVLVVSCENFHDGAILRSDDGGHGWRRLRINDRQRNSNLEGIGFLDGERGWVGGWGDRLFLGGFTSATSDGGANWHDANEVGFRLNRFRFIGDPPRIAYASGDTVYKFSDEPAPTGFQMPEALRTPDVVGAEDVALPIDVPEGAGRLQVRIWERFGLQVRFLIDEIHPEPGQRLLEWNFTDDAGNALPLGSYIVRFTVDDESSSRIVQRSAD